MCAASKRLLAGVSTAMAVAMTIAASAPAAAPHTVLPGETLWSIAASNNLTTRTVAVFNGLPENGIVIAGATIQVPTVTEGAAALAGPSVAKLAGGSPAPDARPAGTHQVDLGETLSGIAAVNGVSTLDLAAANARGSDSGVQAGESLQIPAPSAAPSVATGQSPTAGLGHIPSPSGELHLEPSAAVAWNGMREESLRLFGQDLHPGGPLSAYRTYEQQAQLYEQFVDGQGPPASPPGGSNHERGTSVDVDTPEMRWVVDELGSAFGWGKLEAPSEWWHVTYAP